MKITFMGKNDKIKYSEYVKMIEFFCKKLIKPKDLDKLTVNISFERGNPDHVRKKGETFEEDLYEYSVWIRPTMCIKEQQLTLAHELVHVKQFLYRQMCPETGKILSRALKNMSCSNDYWDNPAEIEANGRAFGLIMQYMQKNV